MGIEWDNLIGHCPAVRTSLEQSIQSQIVHRVYDNIVLWFNTLKVQTDKRGGR